MNRRLQTTVEIVGRQMPLAEHVLTGAITHASQRAAERSANAAKLHAMAKRHHDRLLSLRHLPRHAVGAEIGVFEGDNASTLLRMTRPRHLFLIDPWQYYPDLGKSYYGKPSQSQESQDAQYERVRDRFRRQIEQGQITVIRKTSVDALDEMGTSLDYVYVDGDHRYEGVKTDLESYAELLRPGGVLLGDDYGNRGWWDNGVQKAVDEFAQERNLQPVIYGAQFLIRTPD